MYMAGETTIMEHQKQIVQFQLKLEMIHHI